MRERLLLIAGALAAFGYSLAGSFHFDDYSIFSLPALASAEGWRELLGPLTTRPLTMFTFWLNFRLGGNEPWGYHLLNLALHVAAVLLLWDVLRRVIPARAALIGALVFAVHPIQSEPVAYIFARAILLATVFCLLSALAWLEEKRWLAVLLFALALLAKEEVVAFPLVLWLVSKRTRKDWPILAMLGLSLASGLHVMWVARSLGTAAGAGAGAGISPVEYLGYQGSAILRYFGLVAIPWGYTVDAEVAVNWVVWPVVVVAAVLAWQRKWWPLLAALVLLAPSSTIFPAADVAVDRRMYLPMTAVAAGIGLILARLNTRWVAGISIVLIALSIGRMEVWRTEVSLWEEAARRAPSKVRPKIQLARAVEPERALQLLADAKKLAPEDPQVASEAGRICLQTGRAAEALGEFGRALALSPQSPQAISNRGAALMALGQADAAQQDFRRALQIDPCLFEARMNLREGPGPGCRYSDAQRQALSGARH